jgi:hypothetical protein
MAMVKIDSKIMPFGWSVTGQAARAGTEGALLVLAAQYFAGLPVNKVQLGASEAGDHLIFVFGHVLIVVQPMLDFHRCRWAGENERGHHQNMTALRR